MIQVTNFLHAFHAVFDQREAGLPVTVANANTMF
jgi:hypothetical protein